MTIITHEQVRDTLIQVCTENPTKVNPVGVNDEGDPDSPGSVFMGSMQDWFDSCWKLLADPV